MTNAELCDAIRQVIAYNWPDEYADALESGNPSWHIIRPLIALAEFIGEPPSAAEYAALENAR